MTNRFQPGADCPLTLVAIEENAAELARVIREMKNDLFISDRQIPSVENAARRCRIARFAENIQDATKRLLEDWID